MDAHKRKIGLAENGCVNNDPETESLAENPTFQNLAEVFDKIPGNKQELLIETLKILAEFEGIEDE